MIDTDKYEGHTEDIERWQMMGRSLPHWANKKDEQLVRDAVYLLAEVKRLQPMADELIAIWEILGEDYPHVDRAIVKELVERKIGDYYLEECNLR